GSVTIKGSLVGNSTNHVLITARGSAMPTSIADTAIGSLNVFGNVEYSDILAGVDIDGKAVNADAQIGTVTVGNDWIASSLAAGVSPGFGPYFGSVLDTKMAGAGVKDVATVTAKINSVAIGGQALGSNGVLEFYGLVAE